LVNCHIYLNIEKQAQAKPIFAFAAKDILEIQYWPWVAPAVVSQPATGRHRADHRGFPLPESVKFQRK